MLHKVEKRNDEGQCILSSAKRVSDHPFAYEHMRTDKETVAHLAFADVTDNIGDFPCDWVTLEKQVWQRNEEQWEEVHTIATFDCLTDQIIADGERPRAFFSPE